MKTKRHIRRKKTKKLKGGSKESDIEIVKKNGLALETVEHKEDRDVVLAAVKQNGKALKFSPAFFNDIEILSEAIMNRQSVLLMLPPNIQSDKKIFLTILNLPNTDGRAIKFASDTLKSDEDLAYLAVNKNGDALQFLPFFNDNKKIVTIALNRSKEALQYASERLRSDKDFLLPFLQTNGKILKWVSDELKRDREVVLTAIDENPLALEFSLIKDAEIVKTALLKNGLALEFAGDLKEDEKMKAIAYTQHPWVWKGEPPLLKRGLSVSSTNQSWQGSCNRHSHVRVFLKNIFELLYPLDVNEDLYLDNKCNNYLNTGNLDVDRNIKIDGLTPEKCSPGGYIKILLFLHLFTIYLKNVPCKRPIIDGEETERHYLSTDAEATEIIRHMFDPTYDALSEVLPQIHRKMEENSIGITYLSIETSDKNDLFEFIKKLTREGLYVTLQLKPRHGVLGEEGHVVTAIGVHKIYVIVKNSWGGDHELVEINNPQGYFHLKNDMSLFVAYRCDCFIPIIGTGEIKKIQIPSDIDPYLIQYKRLKYNL